MLDHIPFYSSLYKPERGRPIPDIGLKPEHQPGALPMKFYLGVNCKTGSMDYVYLCSEYKEHNDKLNGYSKKLIVDNPKVLIDEARKAGVVSKVPIDDLNEMYHKAAILDDEVFEGENYINNFKLTAGLMKLFFNSPAEPGKSYRNIGPGITVQRFLDYNEITGKDRSSFYEFLSHSSEAHKLNRSRSYTEVKISHAPVTFYVPKQNLSFLINRYDKAFIVTLYDPTLSWLIRDDASREDIIDADFLLDSCDMGYDQKEKDYIRNTIVIQSPKGACAEKLIDSLMDKEIELYVYSDLEGSETLYSEGRFIAAHAAKTANGKSALVFKRAKR